jgi:Aldehyde dehydrogenase family
VVSVTTFRGDDEALSIANDTLYGLGADIWSRDASRLYRFGRAIQAGRQRCARVASIGAQRRHRKFQEVVIAFAMPSRLIRRIVVPRGELFCIT